MAISVNICQKRAKKGDHSVSISRLSTLASPRVNLLLMQPHLRSVGSNFIPPVWVCLHLIVHGRKSGDEGSIFHLYSRSQKRETVSHGDIAFQPFQQRRTRLGAFKSAKNSFSGAAPQCSAPPVCQPQWCFSLCFPPHSSIPSPARRAYSRHCRLHYSSEALAASRSAATDFPRCPCCVWHALESRVLTGLPGLKAALH